MEKIPLAVRRGLRDDWERPEAPARIAIVKLSELLGLEVTIDLDVAILWAEMQKFFPDKDVFIPTIVGIIKEWVGSLTDRLEEDSNAHWTDKLLEYLGRSGRGSLKAKVETTKGSRPRTWLGKSEIAASAPDFVIAMPEGITPSRNPPSSAASFFETDFQAMFDGNIAGKDDGWTAITSAMPPQQRREAATKDQFSKSLPSLDTLPRPERLFDTLEPYYLIVKILHNGMVVQSSHQPSLELLAGYLRKYTKPLKNVTVKIPEATIELHESKYGLGSLFDSLSIMNADNRSTTLPNPALILAFIEGVLGYNLITQSCTDSQWYFRRGTA